MVRIVALLLALTSIGFAQQAKPTIKLAKDGFPSGHATPEGAACDLARAFITKDAALFRSICLKPTADQKKSDYGQFMDETAASIKAEKKHPSGGGPRFIAKVFAARKLSKNGPNSVAYAVYNFEDLKFVDVECALGQGKSVTRALLVKEKGKWFVIPYPPAFPLISAGLNAESASTMDFKTVYSIKK